MNSVWMALTNIVIISAIVILVMTVLVILVTNRSTLAIHIVRVVAPLVHTTIKLLFAVRLVLQRSIKSIQ